MIYEKIVRRESVDKGWSGDGKWHVWDTDGKEYLLRVSPMERFERRQREFWRMEQVAALGIPMCLPVEFGTCGEGAYTILSWIDGYDAGAVIPDLCRREQYAYGWEAGAILKKLHSIPAPEGREDWAAFFNRKIDRKIAMYDACPLKYQGGQAFLDYLAENRHLLEGSPQTYQHGDYHIGNMMVTRDGKLVIIDFDREDWGDPWEEFNRIVWCAQEAPFFAAGMVDGYFDGSVPMEFWRLLALYICSNTLSSLPWAIPFGEEEVQVMRRQARDVLAWYDDMKNVVPAWYRKV